MTPQEAAHVCQQLVQVYKQQDWDGDALAPYVSHLVDLPYEVGNVAMATMCETARYPSLAAFLEAVRAVRRDMSYRRDPLALESTTSDQTRRQIHEAKLNRIQAKASPADDPDWEDDTPPWREVQAFADYFEALPPEQRRNIARMSPLLARKLGVKIGSEQPDDEKQAAIERARAMKRGGWA